MKSPEPAAQLHIEVERHKQVGVHGGSDSGHQETCTQAGKTHCVVKTCQSTWAGKENGAGIRMEMELGYMSRGSRCGLRWEKVLDSLGAQPSTGTELSFEQWAMVSSRPCPQQDPHLQALPGQDRVSLGQTAPLLPTNGPSLAEVKAGQPFCPSSPALGPMQRSQWRPGAKMSPTERAIHLRT